HPALARRCGGTRCHLPYRPAFLLLSSVAEGQRSGRARNHRRPALVRAGGGLWCRSRPGVVNSVTFSRFILHFGFIMLLKKRILACAQNCQSAAARPSREGPPAISSPPRGRPWASPSAPVRPAVGLISASSIDWSRQASCRPPSREHRS